MASEPERSAPTSTHESEPWANIDWQRLWLSIQGRSWRTLAMVPAGSGAPRELTLDAASNLARTGMLQFGAHIYVADATELEFADMADFVAQLRETLVSGPVILALAPAIASAVTIQLARSCDISVLCVALKRMRVVDAKRTVEEIGRERFFGAITFS